MNSAWHSLFSPLLAVILLFILQVEIVHSRSLVMDQMDAKSLQKHPSQGDIYLSSNYDKLVDKRQSYFDSLAGQSLGKRSGHGWHTHCNNTRHTLGATREIHHLKATTFTRWSRSDYKNLWS
uniref:Uncharacterized protein n=1 Tax=Ditylenchus dipsaci TaxID=166011 RepID=A0A915EFP0_9BILA